MRPCISIRGCVRPSACPSVHPAKHPPNKTTSKNFLFPCFIWNHYLQHLYSRFLLHATPLISHHVGQSVCRFVSPALTFVATLLPLLNHTWQACRVISPVIICFLFFGFFLSQFRIRVHFQDCFGGRRGSKEKFLKMTTKNVNKSSTVFYVFPCINFCDCFVSWHFKKELQ